MIFGSDRTFTCPDSGQVKVPESESVTAQKLRTAYLFSAFGFCACGLCIDLTQSDLLIRPVFEEFT